MQDSQEKRLDEILEKEISNLRDLTSSYITNDIAIHKMEKGLLSTVLSLCLNLLKFVIAQKVFQHQNLLPELEESESLKKSGNRSCKYLSLFGVLEYRRPSLVSNKRGMIYMVDEVLLMPKNLWSYNISELVGSQACHINFRTSVELLNKLLDLGLSGTGSERNIGVLGKKIEAYYEEKPVEKINEPVCYSASFDGKGVPKIIDSEQKPFREIKRLSKGEKKGKKQMATVCVMSYFQPKKRKVSSIVAGLMGLQKTKDSDPIEKQQEDSAQKENDNTWHQAIHRRGFLANQEKSIEYGIRYIKDRIKHPQSRFVVPIDAGKGLEDKVLKCVKDYDLEKQFDGIILDIIHVSEYVWDAANALFGEGCNLRVVWVKKMLEDLLNSQTNKVIKDLQNIVDKDDLTDNKKEKIKRAITYFTNHKHKMDYQTFLEKGYPVSSALVESNCKHLVKDRMEHSGMRWSSEGAQSMLDCRAVKLNGDMEEFMKFVQNNNSKTKITKAA